MPTTANNQLKITPKATKHKQNKTQTILYVYRRLFSNYQGNLAKFCCNKQRMKTIDSGL